MKREYKSSIKRSLIYILNTELILDYYKRLIMDLDKINAFDIKLIIMEVNHSIDI